MMQFPSCGIGSTIECFEQVRNEGETEFGFRIHGNA